VGVLGRFEKGIERAVNGAFARAFRSEVQPVELASAIKREADDNASVVGRNRTIAPNDYVIELGPADHRRLAQWEEALGDELSAVLNDHALQQRYAFVGPVKVRFERSEELDTGVFRVRSRTVRPEHGDGDERAARQAAGYPQGAHQQGFGGAHDPYAAAGYPAAAQVPPGHPASAAPYAPPYSAPYPPPGYPTPGYRAPGYAAPGYAAPESAPPESAPPEYGAAEPYVPPPAPAPYAYPAPVDRPTPALELDGRRIPLTRAVTVLGRAADVDVPLDDAGVSRRHAEVHVTDGRYRVVDLGSTNGTFVDGERVTAGELRDGSTITVGRSRLVFRLGQR
jgi:hypothetical protein